MTNLKVAITDVKLVLGGLLAVAILFFTQLAPGVAPIGIVVQGLIFGTVTGLLALGLVLVYRTTRVVNFAYGAMGGFGATFGVMLYFKTSVPWPVAVVLAVAMGVLVGIGTELVVIRRFRESSRLVLTMATVGLAQVLGGMALVFPGWFNHTPLIAPFRTTFSGLSVNIQPVIFSGNDLFIVVIVPLVLAGLSWFLLRTDYGMALRALAENSDRALLLGVPVRKLSTLVWAIVGGLAALTIMVRAPGLGITLDVAAGPAVMLPALAAAVVGGMTSLGWAFSAGLALGVMDSLVRWNFTSQSVANVAFFAVILVALLVMRWSASRAEERDESSWTLVGNGRPLPEIVANLPEVRIGRGVILGLIAAAAMAFPLFGSASQMNRLSTAFLFGAVALSLVVLTGWGGTVSLGQYAIVGVGAVVTANMISRFDLDLFLSLGLSGLSGALIAVVVGLPALRVKGIFLAVTTFAFAIAMDSFFLNPVNFPSFLPSSLDRPVWWQRFDLRSESSMYFLCLLLLVGSLLVVRAVRRSRTGRVQLASRDNPRAAAAMGVAVVRSRMTGFVLSGVIAGLAGGLHVLLLQGVGFKAYEPSLSLQVFSMAVIGGIGSISGSLVGVALVMAAVIQFPTVQLVITGAALLVILWALPGGAGQALEVLRDRVVGVVAGRRGITLAESFADGTVGPAHQAARATRVSVAKSGGKPLLELRDVTASYGPLQVLFGVDLQVKEGEIVALLGTNGAGKSTALKVLTNLLPPDGGQVELDGKSLRGVPTDQIARLGIGLMPGGRGVFPTMTVQENLRLGCWMIRRDAKASTRAVDEALAMFPILGDRAQTLAGDLSGGEQQMLSLAMAFMTRPKVLCIDELSLGLAPTIVSMLCDKVREMHESGTTILVVEQSVSTALVLARRAVFLEKGEVRFEGPTKELLDRPDLARSVFIGAGKDGLRRAKVHESTRERDEWLELRCTGLTKRFGGIIAVDAVDLTVAPGKIIGLIGHNGAGKTTLFDLLSGFLEPDAGRVLIGEADITDAPAHERAVKGLGRSFQEALLFPSLTVAETIKVALELHLANRDPVAAALGLPASLDSEASADERAEQIIEMLGLGGYRGHRTSELSTGTRRIVELGCVLAQDPAVLLLDEPSSGVAQRETEALGPLLRQVMESTGCSMIVVEHDMALVRAICDEVVALELGAVIAQGRPKEVLEHPKVIRSYLGVDGTNEARTVKRSSSKRKASPKGRSSRRVSSSGPQRKKAVPRRRPRRAVVR